MLPSLSTIIRERRSIRRFRPDPVPVSLLHDVFEEIRFMPCPTNRQCFQFVAVEHQLKIQAMKQEIVTEVERMVQKLDTEDGEKFRKYAEFFTFFEKAPLTIVGLYRTFVSRLPSGDPAAESIQGLAEIQAFGGAVSALLLELHARGLGACWMTGPLIAERRILQVLDVENPWRLGAVIPIGYPLEKADCPKKPPREKVFSVLAD